jgi:hypothetical protein
MNHKVVVFIPARSWISTLSSVDGHELLESSAFRSSEIYDGTVWVRLVNQMANVFRSNTINVPIITAYIINDIGVS